MIPWRELGRARVAGPSGAKRRGQRDKHAAGPGELVLSRRGDEFAIRLRGAELMNSRSHHSEEQLAKLSCAELVDQPRARVLIGGLGMGFTARAALDALGADAQVTIVELVPEVVTWNREHLGDLARKPLDDPRVAVRVGDVGAVIGEAEERWNAILLDVDNGPDAFTSPANAAIYGLDGLIAARRALVRGGVVAVWSVENDKQFTGRLGGAGFEVETHKVPSRAGSNVKHVIWVARRR